MQTPNPMMNHPVFQFMNAMRSGNYMQVLQQAAGKSPYAAQALQAVQGKSPQQMRQAAENMAKEHGVSLQDFAGHFGITLPK